MRIPDLIITGWTEIWAHKLRSFLSFFSIAIGIATFFYTLSVLSQKYRAIHRTVEIMGKGRVETSTDHPLSMTQYNDLLARLPEGSSLSFETPFVGIYGTRWSQLYHHNQQLCGALMVGILPTWKDTDFVYRLEGRFINWHDIANNSKVIVLTVFPREKESRYFYWNNYLRSDEEDSCVLVQDYTIRHNLLNQQVVFQGQTFTVVGLLHLPTSENETRLSPEITPYLYIPYTTWYSLFSRQEDTHPVQMRVATGKDSTARNAAGILTSFLRAQFGPEEKPKIEFFADIISRRLKHARKSLNKMCFMGLIAMIAGGIGIMNVTMAVIFSRTKEIGIRRALGASHRDILFQFVVEAMLLGLCGAVFGMILGYMAVLHLAQNTHQMTFSWWVVALSVLIALVTSFLFALYPAWKAAKLKPVDALKNE